MLFTLLIAGSRAQDAPQSKPPEPPKADADKPGVSPSPNRPTPFAEALALYRSENYESALAKFTEIGSSQGANAAASYAWAVRAALHLKKTDLAESDAEKAAEVDKNLPTVQSAMGEVYFRQGKFSEAESVYRKLLLANILDPRACLGLARIYQATANYKSAKTLLDQAHQQDNQDPDIFWEWLKTLNHKERLEALKARLAQKIGGGGEQIDMQAMIAVLQDREKRPERGCRLVTMVDSTETHLETLAYDPKRLRGFGLLVKINDDKGAKLLIDTGAGGILINSKVAERAGLERVAGQDISGIGDKGASYGYIAYAQKIQIGDLQFENCYVDVVDRKSSLDEEGLIGTDVFEDFLVNLDFPDRKFRLSQLPPVPDEASQGVGLHSSGSGGPNLHNRFIPPQYANFERVYRIGHNLLVPTRLNDAPQKLFVLDTGAWDNTVSPAAAREATKVYSDSDIKVKGLSGEVKNVYTTGNITLTFGRFQQKRRDLVAFDMTNMSDQIGTEISGTLGFAMLFMLDIKIDYRDNLIDFTYNPNRFY